ncbi:MAG: ferric reductase-like transmembrane domain-containing protein, partial [Thermoleophilia bacterium]|nr:ferric reductase-like transmembrane domain-containing protein [Thermoleophilia bacterium]
MTIEMLPWIIVRATGFVAFGLISCAMIAGLLVRTRGSIGSIKAGGMVELHRHLSLLGLMAIGAHALMLLVDTTIDISPLALVVPGLVPYRPIWTGLGVVAAELALLIHLSFKFRTRIGGRNWRRLHWLTYAVFVVGAIHGITSGTDSGTTWAIALYGAAVAAVAGLTGWRAASFRRT